MEDIEFVFVIFAVAVCLLLASIALGVNIPPTASILAIAAIIVFLMLCWVTKNRRIHFTASKRPGSDVVVATGITSEIALNGASPWVKLKDLGMIKTSVPYDDNCNNCLPLDNMRLLCNAKNFGVYGDEIVYTGCNTLTFLVTMSIAAYTSVGNRRMEIKAVKKVNSATEGTYVENDQSRITFTNTNTTNNPTQTVSSTFAMNLSEGSRFYLIGRLAPNNDETTDMTMSVRDLNITFSDASFMC